MTRPLREQEAFSICVKILQVAVQLFGQPFMFPGCPLCFHDFSNFGNINKGHSSNHMTLYVFRMPLMFPQFWGNFESTSGNIRGTALYEIHGRAIF